MSGIETGKRVDSLLYKVIFVEKNKDTGEVEQDCSQVYAKWEPHKDNNKEIESTVNTVQSVSLFEGLDFVSSIYKVCKQDYRNNIFGGYCVTREDWLDLLEKFFGNYRYAQNEAEARKIYLMIELLSSWKDFTENVLSPDDKFNYCL